MLKNKKKKDKIVIYIILLLILLIILLLITAILNIKDGKEETTEYTTIGQIDESEEDEIIKKLASMKERERMEYYFNVFYNDVENGNYENAYNLLNDSFKETYFPTCDQFKDYCEKTFTDMMNISQDNIERNGDVYVLWISLYDTINGDKNNKKEFNIVIKENDFYDFELSFSII